MDKKKVISDSLFLTISSLSLNMRGLIFLPIIIPLIGMKLYGAFVLIMLNPGFIIPLCTLSMGAGFSRFASQYEDRDTDHLGKEFWSILSISFALSIFGALILFFFSPLISKHILAGIELNTVRLSSITVITGVIWEQLTKYIQCRKRFKLFSMMQVLYLIVPYIGFVIGLMMNGALIFGVMVMIIIQVLINFYLLVLIKVTIKFKLPSLLIIKKYLNYSWGLILSEISGRFLNRFDRNLIGIFLGPIFIGYYSIIRTASSLLEMFTIPFRQYFQVYLPKVWDRGGKKQSLEQIKKGMILYLSIVMIVLMILTCYLVPAVKFILKKDLNLIHNIRTVILLLGLSCVLNSFSGFYNQLIGLYKKNHYLSIFPFIGAILNSILSIILIMRFSILGIVLARIISFLIILLLKNFFFRIRYDLPFITNFLRIVSFSLSSIIVYNIILPTSFLTLVLSTGLSFTVYTSGILLSNLIFKNEYRIINLLSIKKKL